MTNLATVVQQLRKERDQAQKRVEQFKGCDGACIHAVGSLAGAGGWSITNVAAFPISSAKGGFRPRNSLDSVFYPPRRANRHLVLL
jgi:hypothetical protein